MSFDYLVYDFNSNSNNVQLLFLIFHPYQEPFHCGMCSNQKLPWIYLELHETIVLLSFEEFFVRYPLWF